jgi:CRP/FNR family transcriptional regulator, cyclic AMP receptor protein
MNARIELLEAMPLFGGLAEESLVFLLGLCSEVSVAAGEFFFREGEQAQSLFVLQEGKAAVVKNWQGHHYVLMHLAPGDCFGEMSLMDMHHRSASVVAVEPCRAIELSAASLLKLYEKDLEQFTVIQMNMGREVSRRLRDADERLFEAKMGVPGVLAEYVVRST